MNSLPLQVSDIASKLNIGLYKYSQNKELLIKSGLSYLMQAKGFAYMSPVGKLMIFFDDSQSRQEIRYTIAHELGHILLGHVDSRNPRGRLLEPSNPKLEREADSFALRKNSLSRALPKGRARLRVFRIKIILIVIIHITLHRSKRLHFRFLQFQVPLRQHPLHRLLPPRGQQSLPHHRGEWGRWRAPFRPHPIS